MSDAANLAVLHLLGWSLLRWLFMAEVLKIRIARIAFVLEILSLLLSQFLHTIVKLITGFIRGALRFFSGDFRRINFLGKVRL